MEEHLLANGSHLVDEFFKLSMVVDGSTKKFGLLVGKGDRDGLGFDFSRPAPVALWALAQTALSHPIQGEDLSFAALEAFSESRNLGSRK